MSEFTWIGEVYRVHGALATVLLAILVLVLLGYRRDFLLKHMLTKEDRDRMTTALEGNTRALEKMAESAVRLSDTTREASDKYTRQIEDIIRLAEQRPTRTRKR